MFRDSFKYYKSRNPPPNLDDVIDFANPHCDRVKRRKPRNVEDAVDKTVLGLREASTWECWEFMDIPGLVFIRNPFTASGQRYWITKCFRDYSGKPYKTNLDAHDLLGEGESWWHVSTQNSERSKKLVPKLRWATLGYHHDWDTKNYSEASRIDMPQELAEMTGALARVTGYDEFKAEAAIVNYYRMNSTLAGHTDHSEVDKEAPLFSISFGQSAIFLIGGLSQDEPACAMILRSGDVVAMTGESRLRYHGVPKILPADASPWNFHDDTTIHDEWSKAESFVDEARININVRQVLKRGQSSL